MHTGHHGAKNWCACHCQRWQSPADAPGAMASIAAAVAAGAIIPREAAELSRLVEAYIKRSSLATPP